VVTKEYKAEIEKLVKKRDGLKKEDLRELFKNNRSEYNRITSEITAIGLEIKEKEKLSRELQKF
jgi:hypothetical protein